MIRVIAVFAFLLWSGMEPAVSLIYCCIWVWHCLQESTEWKVDLTYDQAFRSSNRYWPSGRRSLGDSSAVSGAWETISVFLLNFSSCLQDMPQWRLLYSYTTTSKNRFQKYIPSNPIKNRISQGNQRKVSWCASFLLSKRKNESQKLLSRFFLRSCWPALSHMAIPSCNRIWEIVLLGSLCTGSWTRKKGLLIAVEQQQQCLPQVVGEGQSWSQGKRVASSTKCCWKSSGRQTDKCP